ncbi:MAG: ROK family protein [Beduini sp.]|uniref:ROK family protein n=1 Tax=Beduini sp. TaxID=1922300 RepID=UPI0011C94CFC
MYKSKGEKNVSIQCVKDYFIENKTATKTEIASATRLSLATVTNILKELLESKYIVRIEDEQSTGGRKAKRYQIYGQYMLFGLMSLQNSHQQINVNVRIVDLDYAVVYEKKYQFDSLPIEKLLWIIEEMKNHFDFSYLSLSVPAIADQGKVSKCDIEELENCQLKDKIESATNLQVTIENDVNTAMLGYIYLHSINKESIAFIYQPDNHHSGCSLYVNQAIVYGATHFAGELGYLPNGTLKEQELLLKENPLVLLVKQAASVISIINPSHMVLYTPCVNESDFKQMIQHYIPQIHQPNFEFIENMDEFTFMGLNHLCIDKSRYKLKKEND